MRLWDYVYTIRNNALIFDMHIYVIQHKRNVFWGCKYNLCVCSHAIFGLVILLL